MTRGTGTHRVTGVRAEPGGRLTLHFTDDGYRIQRRGDTIEWLLDDLGCGTSLVVAVAFGAAAAYAYGRGLTVLAVVLAVLALPGALVVIARVLVEAAGQLIGFLLLAAAVLLFPLLVFPSVRRWARAWFRGSDGPKLAARSHVPASAVTGVEFQRVGAACTVAVRVGDESVRYTALDADGGRLEHGFRMLLAGRGIGSTP